jgi:hypothetical protein
MAGKGAQSECRAREESSAVIAARGFESDGDTFRKKRREKIQEIFIEKCFTIE